MCGKAMKKTNNFISKAKANKALNKNIVLWIIVFRVTLELSYIFAVQTSYGYYGFELNYIFYKILLSWLVFFIFSFSFKKIISTPMNPSNIVILIFSINSKKYHSWWNSFFILNICKTTHTRSPK